MRFPECLTSPIAESTFGGLPISQTWQDLALWESFLDTHPVTSIVELGTWMGGMGLFLGTQCRARGAMFVTIDRSLLCPRPDLLRAVDVQLLFMDLLSESAVAPMGELFNSLPTPRLLFCDNGTKALEVARFVPLLSPGDFVAVHDWNTEFHPDNVLPCMEMLMIEECESTQSMTRFFAVV